MCIILMLTVGSQYKPLVLFSWQHKHLYTASFPTSTQMACGHFSTFTAMLHFPANQICLRGSCDTRRSRKQQGEYEVNTIPRELSSERQTDTHIHSKRACMAGKTAREKQLLIEQLSLKEKKNSYMLTAVN